MRGTDHQQADMYSYISAEVRIRADHPLRPIREMADAALKNMSERFDAMYARTGRPSTLPRSCCERNGSRCCLRQFRRLQTFLEGAEAEWQRMIVSHQIYRALGGHV